jgi:hypothetical protein
MSKRGPAPVVVRHSYAPDPDPAKVEAALDLWRRALAQRMAGGQTRKLPAGASTGGA